MKLLIQLLYKPYQDTHAWLFCLYLKVQYQSTAAKAFPLVMGLLPGQPGGCTV